MFQRSAASAFNAPDNDTNQETRPNTDQNSIAEAEFQRKVRGEVDQIYNSLQELINTSMIQNKDKYALAREKYIMKTKASSMVRSAESLFSITSDLKRAHLFDFHALSNIADEKRSELRSQLEEKQKQIQDLKEQLHNATNSPPA